MKLAHGIVYTAEQLLNVNKCISENYWPGKDWEIAPGVFVYSRGSPLWFKALLDATNLVFVVQMPGRRSFTLGIGDQGAKPEKRKRLNGDQGAKPEKRKRSDGDQGAKPEKRKRLNGDQGAKPEKRKRSNGAAEELNEYLTENVFQLDEELSSSKKTVQKLSKKIIQKRICNIRGKKEIAELKARLSALQVEVAKQKEACADEVRCPITREMMLDPVMAQDGYTYERDAIEAWFRKQEENGDAITSPMTRAYMSSTRLQSDRIVKGLIEAMGFKPKPYPPQAVSLLDGPSARARALAATKNATYAAGYEAKLRAALALAEEASVIAEKDSVDAHDEWDAEIAQDAQIAQDAALDAAQAAAQVAPVQIDLTDDSQ